MPFRQLVLCVVVSLGGLGCAHAGGAAGSGWSADCGAPVEGLLPLVAPGKTLVLGEVHGTREVAAFVYSAACQAAHGGPAVLGLEMPAQPQFEAFLTSDGGPEARKAFLAAPFWTAAFQDGRENTANLELLDKVRMLRQRGLPLELLLFDEQPRDPSQRDRLMAQHVLDFHAAHPGHTMVLVMGDLHARKKPGSPWKPDDGYGWLASRLTWPVVSLTAVHEDGTAWICRTFKPEDCGPKVLAGRDTLGRRAVKLTPLPQGHDGVFDVGGFTAAPPAAFPEKAVGFEEKLAELMKGPELMAARGRSAAVKGDYATCARLLGELPQPDPVALYDLACCLSRTRQLDAAFGALNRALAAGFDDFRTLEEDEDLANLRPDPRWAALKKK